MRLHQDCRRRHGAMVPLFALLLVPLLGMLAFSIDAGYMVLVRTDLQNAADSAALAGAEKMQELWVQYYTPGQPNQSGILTSATTNTSGSPMATAERFATYNRAGNVNLTLLDQDVHFGFTNASGNFGLLDVGPPANNVPAFRNWIDDGQTPNYISYLLNSNLLPVSMQSPKSWKCGPGLKSTLQSDFNSQMWKPNLIPLFQAVSYSPYQAASGQGQGATYAIVGFVGVDISNATGSGNNMDISIQPMATVDPTAVILNMLPAGTQGSPMTPSSSSTTTITTFGSAKLTN